MRLVCDKCSAVYTIEDGLVGGRDFRVSCKACGTLIVVKSARQVASEPPRPAGTPLPPPAVRAAAALARPASFAPSGHETWFVMLGGKQEGPHAAEQLAQLLEQGRIDWTTQVWREGLKAWRPARRDAVLVTAVAGARGVANDTMRLNAARSFIAPEDTVVEGRPERPPLQRPTRRRVAPNSGNLDLLSSDTEALDMRSLGKRVELPLPDLTPSARPRAWDSPENAAFRAGLGLTDSTQHASAPPPRPAEIPGLPPEQPRDLGPGPRAESATESWAPRPRSILAVAAVAFAAGVLAAAMWGRFVGKPSAAPVVVARPAPSEAGVPPIPKPENAVELAGAPALEPAAAPSPPSVPAPVPARELPSAEELRREVRRVAADVKRCVEDPEQGVDVDIYLDGPSGRVRDVDVRSPLITPGRVECIVQAARQMQLSPFSRSELKLMHKFSW